jgi:endonuclease G
MSKWILAVILTGCITAGSAQTLERQLQNTSKQLQAIELEKSKLLGQVENIKLAKIQRDLLANGLPALAPGEEVVQHAAMCLVYSEKHEEAKWVAHIITPDVLSGTVFRTNDFRIDSMVKSGSAAEADYFLTKMRSDSTLEYDGFGYDRGHLAPSADFRWSQKALSESYFYSNMTPQLPEFNREIWGSLEDKIRGYIYGHPTTQVYVVTGPVLTDDLPVIERGVNKVSIPALFWKVAVDLNNHKAIGFVIPNKGSKQPLEEFAMSIDKIETLTSLDLFVSLPDSIENKLEAQVDLKDWLPETASGNVSPIDPTTLPRNHVNTTMADGFKNQKYSVYVCGKVVSSRLSRSGNVLLNLDKQFPNQVFTLFIKKEDIINFSYDPVKELNGKVICAKGKVIEIGDITGMYLENDKAIQFYDERE